jgi:hypothetical protein
MKAGTGLFLTLGALNLEWPNRGIVVFEWNASSRRELVAAAARTANIATIGVLCGGFGESSLRQAGCVEIYPGPAALFACFGDSLLAR